ncbi:MAG: haloacid dehalogenase-like hydrolase [Planctomycetota bacterium]
MYAVLFDIDGTLLQTGGAGHVAFSETFRELFDVDEIPTGIAFAGRSDRAISAEIMEHCGIEPTVENWNRFFDDYRSRLERVLKECSGTVLPGVFEVLEGLEQHAHVALGLLTGNTEFGARAKTSAYGLGGRFAFGGYGDERTHRNDIAADARLAAERYAQQSDIHGPLCGAMVIGDTPADVECGRAIDAFVVAVGTGGSSMQELEACAPDLLLADLTDAETLLAEVAAAGSAAH